MTTPETFVITRVFDAPRKLVFKALTDVDHLVHWWGPKGFTMLSATLDLRPGGLFHYGMRSPDGHEMWGKFVYREIASPERLVFINSFSDADGGTTRHSFAPNWPLEVLNEVTLTEHAGKTTLAQQSSPYNASDVERETFKAGHASMHQGFKGTLDQLEAYLATATD